MPVDDTGKMPVLRARRPHAKSNGLRDVVTVGS
jgi:hypothetical protein